MPDSKDKTRQLWEFSLVTPENVPAAVQIHVAAFDTPIEDKLFPGRRTDPEGFDKHCRDGLFDFDKAPPGKGWGKVVHPETGEIVAFGVWARNPADWKQPKDDAKNKSEGKWDNWSGQNKEACDTLFGGFRKHRERIMDGREHIHVIALATKPAYQGQGAISPIIRHIISEADTARIPIHIEASALGLPVYVHFGWVPVDSMDFAGEKAVILVREPQ